MLLLIEVSHGKQVVVVLCGIGIVADNLQQRSSSPGVAERDFSIRKPEIDHLLVRAFFLRTLKEAP